MADLLTEGTDTLDSLELAGALLGDRRLDERRQRPGVERPVAHHADQAHRPGASNCSPTCCSTRRSPRRSWSGSVSRTLAALLRRADSPTAIAGVVFPKALYSEAHPYGRIDTVESVQAITRDDVVALYKTLFLPNNGSVIVVGDTTPDEIADRLETALKDWKPGDAPEYEVPEAPGPRPLTVYLVDKPGAAQSVLYVGQVGVPRSTPDYFPLDRDERDPGRPVLQPDQPEPPRGEGLHLRGQLVLRLPQGPRPVRGRHVGADRGDDARPGRAGQGDPRHHRPPARHRRRSWPSPGRT